MILTINGSNPMKDGGAMVLLSGGQDSTTCLYWAKQNISGEIRAVTFDYGQRHRIEIEAALKIAELANVPCEVVELPRGILASKSFLTNEAAPVETFESFEDMDRRNTAKENKLDSSFVPMRNPLFLTLAVNRAAAYGLTSVVTGLTAADFAEYGGLSYEWFGGFVDAEGYFSADRQRLVIYQNDPMLLNRIGRWAGMRYDLRYDLSISSRGTAELTFGKRALNLLISELSPHLHSAHRRRQAEGLGIKLANEAQLSDAYVTGFWEGDGSIYTTIQMIRKKYPTAVCQFGFYQKDPQVLELIQQHIGGTVYQRTTQNQIWVLVKSDGPLSAKLLRRMRPHMNVLHSFEKVAKARQKVGLPGGGFNPPYPDCSPDFVWRFQNTVDEAMMSPDAKRIVIETPLLYLTKAQSVWLAQSLPDCMEALAHSHTAYTGEYPPITKDHASVLRAQGFEEAGVPDPLVVRAWKEDLMPLPDTDNYDGYREATEQRA